MLTFRSTCQPDPRLRGTRRHRHYRPPARSSCTPAVVTASKHLPQWPAAPRPAGPAAFEIYRGDENW